MDSYNKLIPVLLSLPIKILGTSFAAYQIIVFIMFGFPMTFVLSVAIDRLLIKCGCKSFPIWVSMLIILAVPSVLIPLLNGYCDIADLFVAVVLLTFTFNVDWFSFQIKNNSIVSVLLLLIVFERRYFGFFVVGYVFGLCIFGLINFIQNKRSIRSFVLNLLYIGMFCLVILFLFFRQLLWREIFNNYAVAYSAYSVGDIFDNIIMVKNYFGNILLLFTIIGCVFMLISKKVRPYAGFLIMSVLVTALSFFRVQSIGIHQQYVLLSQAIIFLVFGVYQTVNVIKKIHIRRAAATAITVLITATFAYSYNMLPRINYNVQYKLFSQLTYKPRVRHDIMQLQLLRQDLETMANETQSKAYVISSSLILNDDILQLLYLPDELDGAPFFSASAQVDLIDGFPTAFLNSDVVVVADPVQYHLRSSDQQVVGILANEFLEDGKIGQHFEYVKEYEIEDGVKVKIYKKKTPFMQDDLIYLSEKFDASYSQYPDLFKNRILSYPLEQQS